MCIYVCVFVYCVYIHLQICLQLCSINITNVFRGNLQFTFISLCFHLFFYLFIYLFIYLLLFLVSFVLFTYLYIYLSPLFFCVIIFSCRLIFHNLTYIYVGIRIMLTDGLAITFTFAIILGDELYKLFIAFVQILS